MATNFSKPCVKVTDGFDYKKLYNFIWLYATPIIGATNKTRRENKAVNTLRAAFNFINTYGVSNANATRIESYSLWLNA
jgi:hypothetical protein